MPSHTSSLEQVLDIKNKGELKTVVVRAGAGAGKTTDLVQRVLALAKAFKIKNKKYPNLVVTTFTRKATQELRERLLLKALELQDEELIQFVQQPSHLHISTIHGVLSLFLSRYGAEMGLPPKFSLVDGKVQQAFLRKILRDILRGQGEHRTALESLFDLAGMKRTEQALLSYFELKVSGEFLAPVGQHDLQKALLQRKKNWRDLAEEFLAQGQGLALNANWQSYVDVVKQTLKQLKSSSVPMAFDFFAQERPTVRKTKDMPEEFVELKADLQKQADDMNSFEFTPDFMQLHAELIEQFQGLALHFSALLFEQKISQGQLTMADLESFSSYLIHKYPDSAKYFSQEWDYWLVDEYQDTSPRQVKLLRSLMGDRHHFVVGDPQQSIYLFRGARSEVFTEKENQVKQSKGEVLGLFNNYRSRPELLNFFNHFFERLSPQFQPMSAMGQSPSELADKPVATFIQVSQDQSDSVQLKVEKENKEYQAALSSVQNLLLDGVKASEICILSATNSPLEEISLLARRFNIPVQVHASSKFFERREVRDALALLRFLVNPHDNLNFLELVRSPWFKISDDEIALFAHRDELSYWNIAKGLNSKSQGPGHSTIHRLIGLQQKTKELGYGQVWVSGMTESGLLDFVEFIDPSGRREANLWKLISLVKQQERQPGFKYLEFLRSQEALELDQESSGSGDAVPVIEPNRVNLMTIHASKGLQFQFVILIEMGKTKSGSKTQFFMADDMASQYSLAIADPNTGVLSSSILAKDWLSTTRQREKSEYDRLLYVALTRAKHGVVLIWSKEQKDSWAARMWKPPEDGKLEFQGSWVEKTTVIEPVVKQSIERKNQGEVLPKIISQSLNVKTNFSTTELIEQGFRSPLDSSLKELAPQNKAVALESLDSQKLVNQIQKAIDGVDIHKMFELLKYADLDAKDLKNEKLEKAFDFVRQENSGRILDWIKSGHVEWGFGFEFDQFLIQGQIDLWVKNESGVFLVDYKSGRSEFAEKAFEQLKIYALALYQTQQIALDQIIDLVVVFPLEEKVFTRKAPSLVDLKKELSVKIENYRKQSLI